MFFIPVFAFAQGDTLQKYPKVLNYMGDTVIVFEFNQGLELTKQNEQRKECLALNHNLVETLAENDTIITHQAEKIKNQDTIIKRHEEIGEVQSDLLTICEEEKVGLKKEVKKQRRGKWIAISGAVVIAVLGLIF